MADYPYATPIEKAQLELLTRVADALEGIRFALVSKIIAPPVVSVPLAQQTHVRRVMTESETENPRLGWKPYEEQKNKE